MKMPLANAATRIVIRAFLASGLAFVATFAFTFLHAELDASERAAILPVRTSTAAYSRNVRIAFGSVGEPVPTAESTWSKFSTRALIAYRAIRERPRDEVLSTRLPCLAISIPRSLAVGPSQSGGTLDRYDRLLVQYALADRLERRYSRD